MLNRENFAPASTALANQHRQQMLIAATATDSANQSREQHVDQIVPSLPAASAAPQLPQISHYSGASPTTGSVAPEQVVAAAKATASASASLLSRQNMLSSHSLLAHHRHNLLQQQRQQHYNRHQQLQQQASSQPPSLVQHLPAHAYHHYNHNQHYHTTSFIEGSKPTVMIPLAVSKVEQYIRENPTIRVSEIRQRLIDERVFADGFLPSNVSIYRILRKLAAEGGQVE